MWDPTLAPKRARHAGTPALSKANSSFSASTQTLTVLFVYPSQVEQQQVLKMLISVQGKKNQHGLHLCFADRQLTLAEKPPETQKLSPATPSWLSPSASSATPSSSLTPPCSTPQLRANTIPASIKICFVTPGPGCLVC